MPITVLGATMMPLAAVRQAEVEPLGSRGTAVVDGQRPRGLVVWPGVKGEGCHWPSTSSAGVANRHRAGVVGRSPVLVLGALRVTGTLTVPLASPTTMFGPAEYSAEAVAGRRRRRSGGEFGHPDRRQSYDQGGCHQAERFGGRRRGA